MFVTNWISTTKIQKISEITNFFRHYFLSRTEVYNSRTDGFCEVASYLTTWTYDKMTSQNRSFTLVYI